VGREPNPYLAGLDAKYLAEALHAWKAGRRDTDPSRSMDLIAKNLSDTDVQAAAAYYAAQEKPAPKAKASAKKKPPPPTKAGAGSKAPSGAGAEGGAATSGGTQGPGGNAPTPADRKD
jgi:cytochrome c553